MALIPCPKCGESISDKAEKCVHCGAVLNETENITPELKCKECGTVLSDSDLTCPNCGCPVMKDDFTSQKTGTIALVGKLKNLSAKKIAIGACIAIIVCIIGVFASMNNSKRKETDNYNTYIDNVLKVQELMLTGAQKSEKLCQLTAKVWKNAIYEISDSETNKYTSASGMGISFYDDFNDALQSLYNDSETQSKISTIKSNQQSVSEVLKKLQNAPEDLEKCYDAIMDLNEYYNKVTEFAISPTGSYTTYTQDVNDATSEFASGYKQLDAIIPEKK